MSASFYLFFETIVLIHPFWFVADRNVLLSSRISQVLRISTHRPVFVLGVAHWIHGGDMSLMTLLDQEGYLLQRVDGAYDENILKDVPDEEVDIA